MVKVILAGVFALVMVNIGIQLIKSPEKGLAVLLHHTDEKKKNEEFDVVLRQLASSKLMSNTLRAVGWMMIGFAFFMLFDSLF
ncbi:MAG: hypothetical protein WBP93_00850, partial [Pyrinomonadaceae bacterium]